MSTKLQRVPGETEVFHGVTLIWHRRGYWATEDQRFQVRPGNNASTEWKHLWIAEFWADGHVQATGQWRSTVGAALESLQCEIDTEINNYRVAIKHLEAATIELS